MAPDTGHSVTGLRFPVNAQDSSLATQISLGFDLPQDITITAEDVACVIGYEGGVYNVALSDPKLPVTEVASVPSGSLMKLGVDRRSGPPPEISYVADGGSPAKLWRVPLSEQDAPSVIASLDGTEGVVLDGKGNAYGVTERRVWRVDLESGSVYTVVSDLGDGGECRGVVYNAARSCLYVAERYGRLWRVPLDGQAPSAGVPTSMGDTCDVALQEEVDPISGTVALWAYVLTADGKLWRVSADSPVAVPVPDVVNLAVCNLGTQVKAVDFDSQGNAYIVTQAGVLWKIAQLSRPASRLLVIKTPVQGDTTDEMPEFTGTVPVPAPAGTTVRATDELGTVIAANVEVDPNTGNWAFDRANGPWAPGSHRVTVTACPDSAALGPAAVSFTVLVPGQPVIVSPVDGDITGAGPYFVGTVFPPVAAGTLIRATDEAGRVIADNVRIDLNGGWGFARNPLVGPWGQGVHTVTVESIHGVNLSAPAVVSFTVLDPRQPVIASPVDGDITGAGPYFVGTVFPPVAAGTLIRATDEAGRVIADNVRIDLNGGWGFARNPLVGPWGQGVHTVTVESIHGVNLSAPAVVSFTVLDPRQPVIMSPVDGDITGAGPYFVGTVFPPVAAGTLIRATDEAGRVIADNVRIDLNGGWGFARNPLVGPWGQGVHTVTVESIHGVNLSAPAAVSFTVLDPRPVIVTPREQAETLATPYFTGTVPGTVPGGTTIHAVDEKGTVIADGNKVKEDGTWDFVRSPAAGLWAEGAHTVTVTAVNGSVTSSPAVVHFISNSGLVILTPQKDKETSPTPYFTGKVSGSVPAGTTIHARVADMVIADNVKINADGMWDFVRSTVSGLWTAGEQIVTVTARKDGVDIGRGVVTFKTRGFAADGPVIKAPGQAQDHTGNHPYFTGTIPVSLANGATIHAVDENDVVIALAAPIGVDGTFGFTRPTSAGPWTAGWHTVTLKARRGATDITGLASVTFKVQL